MTVVERRAPFVGEDWTELEVARLVLDEQGRWSSNWADSAGRWRTYPGTLVTDTVEAQLAGIDRHPDGVFWG